MFGHRFDELSRLPEHLALYNRGNGGIVDRAFQIVGSSGFGTVELQC